jgi:hypothetical protein
VIARKAREELNMVFTQPETLQIVIDRKMTKIL